MDASKTNLPKSISEAIPHLLKETTEKLLKENYSDKDIFDSLILVIMIENNFLLLNNNGEVITDLFEYIVTLRENEIENLIATFVFDGLDDMPFKIITSPLGELVLINAFLTTIRTTFSVCIPLNKYIVAGENNENLKFQELKDFTRIFKDNVITPLKSKILHYYRYASASLLGLPPEILLEILLILPVNDVINIGKTCRRMNHFIKQERLWYFMCKRDFSQEHLPTTNWRELYKSLYALREERLLQDSTDDGEYSQYFETVSLMDNNSRYDIIL